VLPARKGGQHALRVVREVVAARPTGGGSDFAAVLDHQVRVLRRRSVVFLVSDFLENSPPPASGGWPKTLARLAQRHDVIAVRVFDPLEEELPAAGLIELREIEGGRSVEVDTRSRAVRERWAASAAERRERLAATLSRARADRIDLDATKDVGEALLAFFRRRALRYGGRR